MSTSVSPLSSSRVSPFTVLAKAGTARPSLGGRPDGVIAAFETGIAVIGSEGFQVKAPTLPKETVIAAIPRVRGISVTGVGLEPVLEQGGRAPQAGLDGLKNAYGGPDRIDALARTLARRSEATREALSVEADIRPVVREVSEEALRMLDAYLNRTDELHPLSLEMLAQAFTGAGERMPAPGEKVPVPDFDELEGASEIRAAVREHMILAEERATEAQVELSQARTARGERVALALGFDRIRGTLIDQRV